MLVVISGTHFLGHADLDLALAKHDLRVLGVVRRASQRRRRSSPWPKIRDQSVMFKSNALVEAVDGSVVFQDREERAIQDLRAVFESLNN